jgi:hypothetical protein
MIAFVFPAVQIFGRKGPAVTATISELPANATQEEVYSAMIDGGLYKSMAILLALVVLIGFCIWAYGQISGD